MQSLTNLKVTEFLAEVASKRPAPGGGSVAAQLGALGASLAAMVINLTIGKKRYAQYEPELLDLLPKAEALRQEFLRLIDEDTKSFMELFPLMKIKEPTPDDLAKLDAATQKACETPLAVMTKALDGLKMTARLTEIGNQNCLSDVGVSALCLRAAFFGAKMNVLINIPTKEPAWAKTVKKRAAAMEADVLSIYAGVEKTVWMKLGGV
jgi:formiminotetrahydrofolate cyclodeaminase